MRVLTKTENKNLQKSLLNDMSCEECYFKALYEIVWNLCKKKIQLTALDKENLKQHVRILGKILDKPQSKVKRASVVKQSGGFLNIAIPLVITTLSEIFRNAIS
jgi:hypothetical protein